MSVTETAHAIDDADLIGSLETVVLQAVIGEDHIGPIGDQHRGCAVAVQVDHDGSA